MAHLDSQLAVRQLFCSGSMLYAVSISIPIPSAGSMCLVEISAFNPSPVSSDHSLYSSMALTSSKGITSWQLHRLVLSCAYAKMALELLSPLTSLHSCCNVRIRKSVSPYPSLPKRLPLIFEPKGIFQITLQRGTQWLTLSTQI